MIRKLLMLISLPAFIYTADASAQYYEIANQIGNLITPALSGGMNYKGFVEAEYLHGLGDYQCDFACLSTVQGSVIPTGSLWEPDWVCNMSILRRPTAGGRISNQAMPRTLRLTME